MRILPGRGGVWQIMKDTMISITDYDFPGLDVYARLNEPQLKTIYEPANGLFIAESPMVIERAVSAGYEPESVLTCKEALEGHGKAVISLIRDRYPDVPVYVGSDEVLEQIRGYQLTRGVLCAMKRREMHTAEDILRESKRVVLLDDVENPGNVGAIIRSAAAMYMDAVILTDDCSDPLYRRAARVSVGTVFQIPWAYGGSGSDCMELLKKYGFTTLAMALDERAVSVSDPQLLKADKLAVIMGNECYGIAPEIMDICDHVVKIPMAPGVDSLNVAAASAVAFYVLGRQE